MHRKEVQHYEMKKKIPTFKSGKEAEASADTVHLTAHDLFGASESASNSRRKRRVGTCGSQIFY
jgi:hypothetical protein